MSFSKSALFILHLDDLFLRDLVAVMRMNVQTSICFSIYIGSFTPKFVYFYYSKERVLDKCIPEIFWLNLKTKSLVRTHSCNWVQLYIFAVAFTFIRQYSVRGTLKPNEAIVGCYFHRTLVLLQN